ncbi:MAG: hypothetical protein LT071_13655 [Nocardioides sp.]|nr:hypothetical protein [Nocardioides sp.]
MARQLPGSVVNSLRVMWATVAVAAVITVLTWWRSDDLLLAWAAGNPSAQTTLQDGGIEALRASDSAPDFVAIAVVAWSILALLALVLHAFLAGGHGWARVMLLANALTAVLVAVTCLVNDLPPVFDVLAGVLLVLSVAQVFFLWRKDTSAYLREV